MKRKLILAAALLVLCTPVLTACSGSTEQSAPESGSEARAATETAASQTDDAAVQTETTAVPTKPETSLAPTEPADEQKDAANTLSKFFDACRKDIGSAIRDFSNVANIPEFSAVTGTAMSEEEAQAAIDEKIKSYSRLDYYEVTDCQLDEEAAAAYADHMAEAVQMNDLLCLYGDGELASLAESLFRPVGSVYAFDVTISKYDEVRTEKMYVMHTGREQWKVDMGLLDAVTGYLRIAENPYVNALAKQAAAGIASVVTKLDSEDAGIQELNGEYHFDGDQLVSADGRTELTELEQRFAEKLRDQFDFGGEQKITHLYIRMENGLAKSIAVQKDFDDQTCYGTWPTAAEEKDTEHFNSIDDAMNFAAGEA